MFYKKETSVKSIKGLSKNDFSLERTLRPLWLLSHYGGILLDWCKEFPAQSRAHMVTRWIVLCIASFLLLSGFGFEAYQLSMEIKKSNSTISSVVPNLYWFSNYPTGIVALVVFLFRRKDLLSLFKDWKRLEEQLYLIPKCSAKRVFYTVYGSYCLICTSGLVASYVLALSSLDASFLLSYYPIVREALTFYGMLVLQSASLFVMWFLVTLADLVPALTFYHAGQILRSLILEIEEHLLNVLTCNRESRLKEILFRYEKMNILTKRANQLFGWLVLVGHTVMVVMICSELYMVIGTVRQSGLASWSHLLLMMNYVARLLISFLLSGFLDSSSEALRLTVSIALVSEKKMSPEDCKKLELFLHRLRESPLAARPLDLYRMTPSFLLTIANLIITYVVVLVQSN